MRVGTRVVFRIWVGIHRSIKLIFKYHVGVTWHVKSTHPKYFKMTNSKASSMSWGMRLIFLWGLTYAEAINWFLSTCLVVLVWHDSLKCYVLCCYKCYVLQRLISFKLSCLLLLWSIVIQNVQFGWLGSSYVCCYLLLLLLLSLKSLWLNLIINFTFAYYWLIFAIVIIFLFLFLFLFLLLLSLLLLWFLLLYNHYYCYYHYYYHYCRYHYDNF